MRSTPAVRPLLIFGRAARLLRANPVLVVPLVCAYLAVAVASLPALALPGSRVHHADPRTLAVTTVVAYVLEWLLFSAAIAMTYGMAADVWRFGRTTLGAGWTAMRRAFVSVALFLLAVGLVVAGFSAPLFVWAQSHRAATPLPAQLGWLVLAAAIVGLAIGFVGPYTLPGMVTGEQRPWRAFTASAALALGNASLTAVSLALLIAVALGTGFVVGILTGSAAAVASGAGVTVQRLIGGLSLLLLLASELGLQAFSHVVFTGLYLSLVGGEAEVGEALRPRYE